MLERGVTFTHCITILGLWSDICNIVLRLLVFRQNVLGKSAIFLHLFGLLWRDLIVELDGIEGRLTILAI